MNKKVFKNISKMITIKIVLIFFTGCPRLGSPGFVHEVKNF